MPVDTLYRTSIISSSTVLLLNPFANLSLAPLSLFSIYGPDLGVWPDCWVSAEFLRAPILRKGSGSTTTTHQDLHHSPICNGSKKIITNAVICKLIRICPEHDNISDRNKISTALEYLTILLSYAKYY